jgi:hypothetical protein
MRRIFSQSLQGKPVPSSALLASRTMREETSVVERYSLFALPPKLQVT